MTYIDVFNGDADGICALHQLRLHQPRQSELVTGVKRDIKLLQRIANVRDSEITVLDISLDSNREALLTLLDNGNQIEYFDHHFAGEIPDHPLLSASIDPAPAVCTSLLVDRHLNGRFRGWAICAAFGDNLHTPAYQLATDLKPEQVEQLRELGELINYNGYGESPEDLHFHPADLYGALAPFQDPLVFYHESAILARLKQGFAEDMANAYAQMPIQQTDVSRVYSFPAQAWSKRVAGVFSNAIAREKPDLAHGLVVDNGDGTCLVSVRAPVSRPTGADQLCRQFETGGGRQAAAGINKLPQQQLDSFLLALESQFRQS